MTFEEAKKNAEDIIKNSKKRPLYRVIFSMAEAYNNTSKIAFDNIGILKNADFAAPAIMCQSFMIELLLKFFIITKYDIIDYEQLPDKNELNGHKYTDLFDKISEDNKSKIAEKFSKIVGKSMNKADFRNALIEIGDEPFIKWRYIYEENGISYMNPLLFNQISDSLGLSGLDLIKKIENVSV